MSQLFGLRKGFVEQVGKIESKIKRLSKRIYYVYFKRDLSGYARSIGVKTGNNCNYIDDPEKIFGSEPWLISIGNHVRLTWGVRIITHRGETWVARELDNRYINSANYAPVVIGNNVFIGMYSIVMPGVKIGNNVIVGAHSVVTHDIPDNLVVCGTPAKKISSIDEYLLKISHKENLEIIHFDSEQKKRAVVEKHPEWFE